MARPRLRWRSLSVTERNGWRAAVAAACMIRHTNSFHTSLLFRQFSLLPILPLANLHAS